MEWDNLQDEFICLASLLLFNFIDIFLKQAPESGANVR
jgi:hypothetical protein